MINYNNGKIYIIEPIIDHDEEDIYIGSTTKQHLSQRMAAHSYQYKRWKNNKTNKIMSYDLFDKYGFENCQIILLENVNVNTKDELKAKEMHYIKLMKCVNKCIPTRDIKTWYLDNKTRIHEYYNENKDNIMEKHKKYYHDNKEKIIEQQRQYKKDNKKKFNCECGAICEIFNKQRHFKSQKHQNFINKII